MKKKPGPVPKEFTPRARRSVLASLRKTRCITATINALRDKVTPLSHARVRDVATEEGVELNHAARRAATDTILSLAIKMRKEGASAAEISLAAEKKSGYTVSKQYSNKMLASSRGAVPVRTSARR